ncbi:hypothetical protein LTR56_027049 [Elasticomyces elasticus]|nr:hypothetical protein LTR56_027049 [Elasticomyces elasticus]KAK3616020.1 hypothetical protein LTR22_027206 [Elasticomyces elasticus]
MVANCPIKAGDFDVEKSHKIPLFAAMMPKPNMPANIGEYFMRSKATLADGTVVACLTGDSKAFETAMQSSTGAASSSGSVASSSGSAATYN